MTDIMALLAERQDLLDRHFDGVMTEEERRRLDVIRNELDEIEMSGPIGRYLAKMAEEIVKRKRLAAEIQGILAKARAL